MPTLYDFSVRDISGRDVPMAEYRDKVLLIVNTASKCGYTPQYTGLEALYRDLKDRGLVVLGFPCNQFGGQEPGNEEQIASFCRSNYDVSFPMFAKVDVNGPDTTPLYAWLKEKAPAEPGNEAIKWNFTKFLVDRKGEAVERFASGATPEILREDIEKLL
jgi:glutathione peroxidase